MSEEELRKKMEFIIEQQAQFAADIQRAQEERERAEKEREAEAKLWREKYNGLTDAMTTVVGALGKIIIAQEKLTEEMRELAAAQQRTDAKLAETDERLNVFINVVERYISERRNGQSGRAPGADGDDSTPSS